MQEELLNKLRQVTEEERLILQGASQIQSNLYTTQFAKPSDFTIDSKKLLEKGCLIEVRPHTRFVHFPRHRHNYVELIYMCSGTTTHILNGTDKLVLQEGDLLFLNQNASHEILPAGENDIAVNFIILRDFLLSALSGSTSLYSYLHFSAKDIPPVLNLLENMIWTIFWNKQNTNTINQTTMGLVLMNLSVFAEKLNCPVPEQYEQTQIFTILQYIETHSGTLAEISAQIRQPTYYVSRLLKKHLQKNFKQLLQERKLQQAAYLLSQSSLSVEQIMEAIGYNNSSYFYNNFKAKYHDTPRDYRKKMRLKPSVPLPFTL